MPTYNALEVMDQIAAPFQQGLTRAHELQRAAAGARVARSTQIGDLTAKRQYDEGVAQQQHLQGIDRIRLAGQMGIETAEAAAAARTEEARVQRQQVQDETLVDARGTLHALTKEAATGTGKDAEGNVIGAAETPFTSEQIDGMNKWQVDSARLKLTEAVQKMHAKKLTRDEALDFLDGIDPKHKLAWAKKEVLDDDPRNMTKEELADVVGQIKYREFIWKNKEGVVKQYDDLMNEQYRMLYDNGWAAVMTGLDERGQPVALPAGVPANISAVGTMLAQETNLGMTFQLALQTALADNPEHFDRVMVELKNGNFTNAVKIATEDADTRTLAGKALADGLASVVEADQSRELSALQQYLFQKQGDAAKLREVMAATADLVRRHPLLEHGRTPDLPPGSEHLDWMSDSNLMLRGETGGEQESWGRGGAEREPQGAGVDIFQTPQTPQTPQAAPVSPAVGAPVSPAVGAPVTPAATGAANISGPPDYAASAAGALRPRSGKWEGGRFQEDKTHPVTPIFKPGTPLKMTLDEARGDTGLTGEGEEAAPPAVPARGVEFEGGIDPRYGAAIKYLDAETNPKRFTAYGVTVLKEDDVNYDFDADSMSSGDAVKKAKEDVQEEIAAIKTVLKKIGATRDAKGKITIGKMTKRLPRYMKKGSSSWGIFPGARWTEIFDSPSVRSDREEVRAYNAESAAGLHEKSVGLFSKQSHQAVEHYQRLDELTKVIEALK